MSVKTNRAFTRVELLVVIAVIVLLAALLVPALSNAKRKSSMISCNGNLKQLYLGPRIWTEDHTNQFPMALSVTNGGAMEPALAGAAYPIFLVMSNEVSTPKILTCPADFRQMASDFSSLRDTNISYFINLAATLDDPNFVFTGDDNFVVNGKPIGLGISEVKTNDIIEWSMERHRQSGNIALTDGSVQQVGNERLGRVMSLSATNRLLIP
jgi:competence protein ComGC